MADADKGHPVAGMFGPVSRELARALAEDKEMSEDWSKAHQDFYNENKDPLALQVVVSSARDFDVPIPTWVRDELARIFDDYRDSFFDKRDRPKAGGGGDLNRMLGAKRERRESNRFKLSARDYENCQLAWHIGPLHERCVALPASEQNMTDFWLTLADELGWDSNTIQNRLRDVLEPIYLALKADLMPNEKQPWFLDVPPKLPRRGGGQ